MSFDNDSPFKVYDANIGEAKRQLKKNSGWIKIAVVLLIAVFVLLNSWYQLEPDEVGVVLRFGKYHNTTESGLHFKIPLVDEVVHVFAKRQHKAEFGFETLSSDVKSSFRRDASTKRESTILTGDLNVAVVEWIVHYKIADPEKFVIKVRNPIDTLRALSEATMRAVVGNYSVTEVLTKGREKVLEEAREQLADLCKRYETGLTIQRIELKDSAPPEPVKPSFNEVNQAEQERDRLKNEAWSQYNKEIPKARGEANQMIQEAEGYAIERVNRARGEANRFSEIQREYARAPKVTRTRMYLETLSEVIPRAGRKLWVDDQTDSVLPMLLTGDSTTIGGAK
jgi:modulator of FtsH protease HflK